jgi:hypothetical protein
MTARVLRTRGAAVASVALAAAYWSPVLAQDAGRFEAGAARVDITPAADALPANFEGVNDPIFVRAIVLGNGADKAALVTADVGAIRTETWTNVSQRMERELGIPAGNLLLTATHTHSVPFTLGAAIEEQIFQAIAEADGARRPVSVSLGTGVSYINVNRNIIDPETNRWWEGPNYDGPSDKTVAVMSFIDESGEPVAVYYNYAVHAVLTGTLDQVSGDIPGATSRYIEESLGGDAVAVWSLGAAGDQNPIYFQQTYDLREIRIADYAARGEDISNAMPPGGQGLDKQDPRVATLLDQQRRMTASMGQMLGEEVLHTMRANMERPLTEGVIVGESTSVSCPGRRRTNEGRAGYPGIYEDADPISIRLSLLRIGDAMIGGVDAEVFNMIAQRFKAESPYKHTMMATLTNGSAGSGYIPNDAAFGYETFEVLSSRLKPGCAESAIVDGLLGLVAEAEATGE